MDILVIGGNGFIGQNVLRQLAQKCINAISFNRRLPPPNLSDLFDKVRFVTGDVMNPYDLIRVIKTEGVNRIIHLAQRGGNWCQANPGLAYEINIMGARNVLEAARIMNIERVVYASSAAVYGNVSGEWLIEDSPKDPLSVYGMTKLAVEHLGFTYTENYNLDFIAIRPSHGIGMNRTGGFTKTTEIIKQVLQGIPVEATGGNQSYEMVHVKDTAKAFVIAATKDNVINKAFHIGTGRRITLFEIANIVREHIPYADIEIKTGFDKEGADRTRTTQPPMDLSRARAEGWSPDFTPESAIKDLIDNLKLQGKNLKAN